MTLITTQIQIQTFPLIHFTCAYAQTTIKMNVVYPQNNGMVLNMIFHAQCTLVKQFNYL